MRSLLVVAAALCSSAVSAQPAGWAIEAKPNAATPAAFKVVAIRTIGASKLVYERSMLGGVSYRVEQDGCASSSGGAGYDLIGAERVTAIRDAMSGLVRDKDNFCKLPASAQSGLLTGLDQAIAAADAAYEKGRPTIAVMPRTAQREGWALEDKPGEVVEGLPANHTLKMRKAAGPILLTYSIDLPLYSDKVSAGSRAVEGKVKDCDYSDSDSTEFVLAANRAKAFRETMASNLAITGCEVTPEQIATALIGFDAAYAALDLWAAERLDERRMLQAAANAGN
jgi:hypothetical protein